MKSYQRIFRLFTILAVFFLCSPLPQALRGRAEQGMETHSLSLGGIKTARALPQKSAVEFSHRAKNRAPGGSARFSDPMGVEGAKQVRQAKKVLFQRLSQDSFGLGEYEKALRELELVNRPYMGIVGQENDEVSYRGYKKKMLAF